MTRRQALVVAAGGIGDILRLTPLIRVLHGLGYQTDVRLQADFGETGDLLAGAREIRHRFRGDPEPEPGGPAPVPSLWYDLAVVNYWATHLTGTIQARRVVAFERNQWIREGDIGCSRTLAAQLGWEGKLPPPFAGYSDREFGLPPRTVALHPGCKPDWPWKKWHGFGEIARQLPSTVIVGTAADLENGRTYFRQPFQWPETCQNHAGKLSLLDTAALLRQCAALVSNDSGLMHLGVALGIPTFGIFGITSPLRETWPVDHFTALSKGLPCEPECRERPWGRRDCQLKLRCLRALTAGEVLSVLSTKLTWLRSGPPG